MSWTEPARMEHLYRLDPHPPHRAAVDVAMYLVDDEELRAQRAVAVVSDRGVLAICGVNPRVNEAWVFLARDLRRGAAVTTFRAVRAAWAGQRVYARVEQDAASTRLARAAGFTPTEDPDRWLGDFTNQPL